MIHCPACGADTRVTDTRPSKDHARRRRVCVKLGCGTKLSTLELIVPHEARFDGSALLVPRRELEHLVQLAARLLANGEPTGEPT